MPEHTPRVPEATCRREFADQHCGKPARYIVWGKLNAPEKLGPRCEDCLLDQHPQLRLHNLDQYAIYKLPDVPAIHAERDRAWMEALLSDKARRALADMVGSAYDRGSVLTLTLGAVIDAALDSLQVSGGAGLDAGDSDQRSTASAAETEAACSPAASVESSGTDKPQPDQDRSPGEGEDWPEEVWLNRFTDLPLEWWANPSTVADPDDIAGKAVAARRYVAAQQAEARLREVEAERDAAIKEADRLKAAHRQAEQQLRSLLTDLQGEAGRIIDSGAWETPAAAAGRLEELIRKYAALASTEQKGAGR